MAIKLPSGLLASVTRAGNPILKLLDDKDNLSEVSYLFKLYLRRVDKFSETCNQEITRTDVSSHEKDEISNYFKTKMAAIIETKSKIEDWINSTKLELESNDDNNSITSNASSNYAHSDCSDKSNNTCKSDIEILELEEESIRLRQMQIDIEKRKRNLLSKKSPDSFVDITNQDTKPKFQYDIIQNSEPKPTLEDILNQQNKISQRMIRNQEMASLPNREPDSFDGSDLTKFLPFVQSFRRLIESRVENYEDRLYYLNQYTKGKPNDLVRSCLYMEPKAGYETAMRQLTDKYGNEFSISQSYLQKLESWPSIKRDDVTSLEELSIFLTSCLNYMRESSGLNQLNSPKEIQSIIMKLPYSLRERWRSYVDSVLSQPSGVVKFDDLVKFITNQSRIMNRPVFGDISEGKPQRQTYRNTTTKIITTKALVTATGNRTSTNNSQNTLNNSARQLCLFCKSNEHKLSRCDKFKEKTNKEKIDFLKKELCCFACLGKGHQSKSCNNRHRCSTCNKRHPTVLHLDNQERDRPTEDSVAINASTACCHTGVGNRKIALATIPVKVRVPGSTLCTTTYAVLDNCSSDCFVAENVVRTLNITGFKRTIRLTTMHEESVPMNTSVINNLEVLDLDENEVIKIPVTYTKARLPFNEEDITKPTDPECKHLNDIPLRSIESDVGLLIGMNIPEALKPLEVREIEHNGLYACRYKLGWTINGPLSTNRESRVIVNRTVVSDIEVKLANMYDKEFADLKDVSCGLSIEDKQWTDIVKESTKVLEDSHFEIDLPLRNRDHKFPNNRPQAEASLKRLRNSFLRNGEYADDYRNFVKTMQENGFVERVPAEDSSQSDNYCNTWYLIHHGVYHKQKKKIRVVFDCSRKYHGTSLNNRLLQGPDLSNNLLGVLLRFRKHRIGMTADIEKMFYQVRVPEQQRDLLRFLWFENDDFDADPQEYRLKVHVFGAISSPSIANYALRQAVETHAPDIADQINESFYVDDLLLSVESKDEAVKRAIDIRKSCQSRGFNLTQFVSNSREVLNELPRNIVSKHFDNIDLDSEDLPPDRALGVRWIVDNDRFGYQISPQNKSITRRGILSTIHSVYDPFGLVGPVLLSVKHILRELCRMKYDWDDPIPEDMQTVWNRWIDELHELSNFTLPRCFYSFNYESQHPTCELHVFGDGSEIGYGAVAYLRFSDDNGQYYVSLAFAKSRMTPMKKVTIPRIELAGSHLAVQIRNMMVRELKDYIVREYFWTDSVTVLKFIRNERTRFQRFVANRVSFIREHSQPEQWLYVASKDNPADIASRTIRAAELINSKLWKYGPEFLQLPHDRWPTQPLLDSMTGINTGPEEINSKIFMTNASDDILRKKDPSQSLHQPHPIDVMIDSTSRWVDVVTRISWLLKVKSRLLNADKTTEFCRTDREEAETCILKHVQSSCFSKEILALKTNAVIAKDSSIRKLSPFLDDSGILRVGGRLRRSKMTMETKHPVLLPKHHRLTDLIISHYHELVGHLGQASTLSKIRERFWPISGIAMVRKLTSRCVSCKKIQGRVSQQKMSDLPIERIEGDEPPFTDIGIDFFGPFHVSNGRKQEKRYGVIFTCLRSRAVHLEMAYRLDVNSFLNCLRRFFSRRGEVKSIRTDNGTNFVGGHLELERSVSEWNQKVADNLRQKNVDWNFNAPLASHHGGIWEREIRTIRKVLHGLLLEQRLRLNDDNLSTLFCEVESILNSRPLTPVSNDPDDFQAITPNHILLMKSTLLYPPGIFSEADNYSKRRWKQVQYLSNLFWSRWRREYVPLLQQRSKWLKPEKSHEVGDLVLMVDPNAPRNHWPMGRIVEVRRSKDELVRVVKLKSKDSYFERPISKIVPLLLTK